MKTNFDSDALPVELDRRESGGVSVTLLWRRAGNVVSVAAADAPPARDRRPARARARRFSASECRTVRVRNAAPESWAIVATTCSRNRGGACRHRTS